jgi:CheY-like chemotaxis protein
MPRAEGRIVLLVEDNPMDVFIIGEILRESGLDVQLEVVKDGQAALCYLDDAGGQDAPAVPDLLLLDLNLPKVPGIEVLRRLRNDPKLRAMPVVIVTSSMAPPDRIATQQLGAAGYFQKPNDLNAYRRLVDIVRGIFSPLEQQSQPS